MSSVSDITDLMLRVGQAQAQHAAVGGQVWGNVALGLGDLAGKSYQQGQDEKRLAAEQVVRDQQLAESQQRMGLEAAAGQRDATQFTAQLAAQAQALRDATHAKMVQTMGAVRGAPDAAKPQVWAQARAAIIGQGWAKPNEVPAQYPGDDAVDAELRGLMSAKEQWDIAHPKLENVPEGGTLVNPNTLEVVAHGAAKPTSYQQKDVLLDGKPAIVSFDPASGKSLDAAGNDVSTRVRPVPTAAQVNINSGDLSTAALDQAAQRFLDTGILPPGYGAAGTIQKTKIMNRAAELNPTAALSRNQAIYKADSANLTNLQKTEGTLSAFESTAGKNLDQFLALADKIPDTGVPWLNTPVRRLNQNMVGSANMAAIAAARDVAMREIARVTNDPKLSGALTDSARAEVANLNPENATLPQIKAVAKVLKQDMANVHAGINQQIASVKAGIGSNPTAPAAPADAAITKPIPGIPGAEATSTDGGKTWTRSK